MLEKPFEIMVTVSATAADGPVVQFERFLKPKDASVALLGKKVARLVTPEFLTGALRARVGTFPITVKERGVCPKRAYWIPALGRIGTFELSANPEELRVQRARVE